MSWQVRDIIIIMKQQGVCCGCRRILHLLSSVSGGNSGPLGPVPIPGMCLQNNGVPLPNALQVTATDRDALY